MQKIALFSEQFLKNIAGTIRFLENNQRLIQTAMSLMNERILSYQRIIERTLKSVDFVRIVQSYEERIRDFAEAIEKFGRVADKFNMIMLEMDWPPTSEIYPEDVIKIVNMYNSDGIDRTKEYVNRFLTEFYDEEELNQKLNTWSSKPWMLKRIPILKAAIKAHISGDYMLSIPAILPQIEGIIAYGYGHKGQMAGWKMKSYLESLLLGENTKSTDQAINDFILGTVLAKFEHGHQINSSLSRHAILHGADLHYGTVENSLKTILLFDYLQDSFRLIKLDTGRSYHLLGCPKLSNSRGQREVFRSHSEVEKTNAKPCKICVPMNYRD